MSQADVEHVYDVNCGIVSLNMSRGTCVPDLSAVHQHVHMWSCWSGGHQLVAVTGCLQGLGSMVLPPVSVCHASRQCWSGSVRMVVSPAGVLLLFLNSGIFLDCPVTLVSL